MKTITAFAAALVSVAVASGPAQSQPYCAAMHDKGALPAKYQKRGPFWSDAASGWIIGDDQMRARFTTPVEARRLLTAIRDEFASAGVTLAVMAAPPRPLFAPAEVRAAMGRADYDADGVAEAFRDYIRALNGAGIPAPDLLDDFAASATPVYFRRDTHWTPAGAALSADALAASLGIRTGAPAPAFSGAYEEKGSLSMVAEAACGARPAPETAAAPEYAQAGDAAALLNEAPVGAGIALVGTSFSDRYERDAYRVADAIAHFTGAEVENFSVSGGGATGAMEAFIRSGRMADFGTVVWESPYSEPLNNLSALRQILGALKSVRGQTDAAAGQRIDLSGKWTDVAPEIDLKTGSAIEFHIAGVDAGQLDVEIFADDDGKTRVKLRKSDRVAATMRSDRWTVALGSIDPSAITRIKLRLKGAPKTAAVMRAL